MLNFEIYITLNFGVLSVLAVWQSLLVDRRYPTQVKSSKLYLYNSTPMHTIMIAAQQGSDSALVLAYEHIVI